MNTTIQQEIDAAISLLGALEADERVYRNDPDARQADRERVQAGFDERRRQTVENARARIGKERERHMRDFEKRRKTSYSPVEVAESWRRIEKLLNAGIGLPQILDRIGQPGFDRSAVQAIRENIATHLLAAAKGRNSDTIDAQVDGILVDVLKRELPLMDPAERFATESFIDLLRAEDAIEQFERLAAGVLSSGRVSTQHVIAVGLAESAR